MKILFIPKSFQISNTDLAKLMAQFTVVEYKGDSLVLIDPEAGTMDHEKTGA